MIWKVLGFLGVVFLLAVGFMVVIEVAIGYAIDRLYSHLDDKE